MNIKWRNAGHTNVTHKKLVRQESITQTFFPILAVTSLCLADLQLIQILFYHFSNLQNEPLIDEGLQGRVR